MGCLNCIFVSEIAVSHASEDAGSTSTVITVPLEFSLEQRELVAKCASKAGFKVAQVISEPAAALMAYGVGQNDPMASYKCLVFRCGGTSLTCSLVSVNGGMISVMKSVTKSIGGDSITDMLVEQLAAEFKRKHKVDPRETKRGKLKLKLNAENVKHVLSTLETANCYIESLHEGIDFNANISRSRFDIEFSKVRPRIRRFAFEPPFFTDFLLRSAPNSLIPSKKCWKVLAKMRLTRSSFAEEHPRFPSFRKPFRTCSIMRSYSLQSTPTKSSQ